MPLVNEWMCHLPSNRQLRHVTMPGSHDAITYAMDCSSTVNPHRHDQATKFAKYAMPIVPCVVLNYSKVQNHDLVDQFRLGVRYFDLRVAKNTTTGQLQGTHGIMGGDFGREVAALIRYVSTYYPREVCLLDIRFVYGLTAADHVALHAQLTAAAACPSAIARPSQLSPSSSLGEFWSASASIILTYPSDSQLHAMASAALPPHVHDSFWIGKVRMIWPNTTDAAEAVRKMQVFTAHDFSQGHVFFGLHATLTPDGAYIARHLFGSTQRLAHALNDELVQNIRRDFFRVASPLSFVMVDVVEHPGLIAAIVDMNQW